MQIIQGMSLLMKRMEVMLETGTIPAGLFVMFLDSLYDEILDRHRRYLCEPICATGRYPTCAVLANKATSKHRCGHIVVTCSVFLNSSDLIQSLYTDDTIATTFWKVYN